MRPERHDRGRAPSPGAARSPGRARSFGAAAGDYERGRPGYPDEAVDWLLARADTTTAVDVGAGTGKFTASLVDRGLEVDAVEPDPAMGARLAAALPAVHVHEGTAEALPLPDACTGLVTFAQSWHWVDPAAASREATCVLRPGGVVALIWNVRDESVDWVAALGAVIGASPAERYDTAAPTVAEPLRRTNHAEFHWENPLDRAGLRSLVASRSNVISLRPSARRALLSRVDELVDTHPQLAGRARFAMPYLTRITLARP